MEFVLLHIPHIIPAIVAMGFLGRFAAVMADQPPAEFSDAQIDEWRRVRVERARARRVRATSARLGLLSLPLLIMAVATGLWLYTVALRDDRPSALAIWLHVVASVAGARARDLQGRRVGPRPPARAGWIPRAS